MPTIPVSIGLYMVNLCSALLLLTCFAIVAQRRLMACVDLFALQSVFLAVTAMLVAYLTGIHHIYVAAVLTIAIKAVILPRILKKIVRQLNVQREVISYVNIPAGLLICGGLVILAFFITQPIAHLGFLLTQDSPGDCPGHRVDRIFCHDYPAESRHTGYRLSGNGKRTVSRSHCRGLWDAAHRGIGNLFRCPGRRVDRGYLYPPNSGGLWQCGYRPHEGAQRVSLMMLPIVLLIATPFLIGVSGLVVRHRQSFDVLHCVQAGSMVISSMLLVDAVSANGPVSFLFFLRADALSAWFDLGIGIVAATGTLYAVGYMGEQYDRGHVSLKRFRHFFILFDLYLAVMLLAVNVENLGIMWIAIEGATLSTALLVGFERNKGALEAGWKFVILSSVGIALALFGTILVYYSSEQLLGISAEASHW